MVNLNFSLVKLHVYNFILKYRYLVGMQNKARQGLTLQKNIFTRYQQQNKSL